jgi:hypothetical protein
MLNGVAAAKVALVYIELQKEIYITSINNKPATNYYDGKRYMIPAGWNNIEVGYDRKVNNGRIFHMEGRDFEISSIYSKGTVRLSGRFEEGTYQITATPQFVKGEMAISFMIQRQ